MCLHIFVIGLSQWNCAGGLLEFYGVIYVDFSMNWAWWRVFNSSTQVTRQEGHQVYAANPNQPVLGKPEKLSETPLSNK